VRFFTTQDVLPKLNYTEFDIPLADFGFAPSKIEQTPLSRELPYEFYKCASRQIRL